MSASITGSSTCSNNRIEPHELSYGEMTVLSSGGVMSKQMKIDLRKQLGYCLTCPHVPVLLIDIRRSRINPLWISKKPRTEDGECIEGRCLKCSPEREVSHGTFPTVESSRNMQLTRTLSTASSISSCSIDSHASPLVTITGSENSSNLHGQVLNGRMLPPRTPSRSSSGDSHSFYCAPVKRTPPTRYLSRNDSSVRDIPRSRSSLNSYEDADDDSVNHENSLRSNRATPKDVELHTSTGIGLCSPSFDSIDETIDDASEKISRKSVSSKSPHDSSLFPIQVMLNEVKSVAGNEVFIECLLSAMESNRSDLQIQTYCLTAFSQEFVGDGAIDDTIFALNGASRVLDAMTTFPTSICIQELGCILLLAIASDEDNRISLIRKEACTSLHRAMDVHCREKSIVEKCFGTVRILSTEMEGRSSMINLNLSNSLISAMQYNMSCASIQQDGCAILSNLAVDVANNEVALVSRDEIAVIVESMLLHNNDESVMASACFALKNFAYNTLNLRSMNLTTNILEALEEATLFESLSISASQTSEKLYFSQAEDESLVDHAYKVLMRSVSTQSDDPEIMVIIIQSLREFKWSNVHVTACLKKLKPLALTSRPHMLRLLESISLDELLNLSSDFPTTNTDKSEITALARLYGIRTDW